MPRSFLITGLICIVFCFFISPVFSQVKQAASTVKTSPAPVNEYAAIDKLTLQLPDSSSNSTAGIAAYINAHFNRSKEKARAAFVWIATNIRYDLENMYALNFYEKEADKIEKPLKMRKGICENYAALFNDICAKTGIKCFVVEGYTRQNGFRDYIPHAWCAAYIDTAWFFFDPTWGSGYVNNGKFYPKVINAFFMATPAWLIKSHMPFDYLWQCLYYPVTSQEFYDGKTAANTSKPYFNYPDSIAAYGKMEKMAYYAASADRIEKNGIKNSMVFDWLRHLRLEIENDRLNRIRDLYNSAGIDFNNGVRAFNEYIDYHNKQFKPAKPDSAIQAMLSHPVTLLKMAIEKIDEIKNPDAPTTALMDAFRRQAADLQESIRKHQDWLNRYFAKPKLFRKTMFSQVP